LKLIHNQAENSENGFEVKWNCLEFWVTKHWNPRQ